MMASKRQKLFYGNKKQETSEIGTQHLFNMFGRLDAIFSLERLRDLADENDMVVTDIYEFKDYLPKKIKQMEDIIEQTYQRTRVYVFVGEHIALVDFVMCLQVRGLLEKGEYIVISVDDEIYDPKNKSNIVHRNYLDPYLSHGIHSIHGFRSVLKLTPSHPLNPRYEELCEEVKNLSSLPPFCVPFHNIISKSISDAVHSGSPGTPKKDIDTSVWLELSSLIRSIFSGDIGAKLFNIS
ncbi:hypothetical protein AAG570_013650 [Ranatra chinensis]|uniref:Uncharacterized protein n=1 Tax=Ranatra chinensis TaxID=642074 RepID=A0ABD0Z134_9HEMI